jgi:hypothetical protein
MENTPFNFVAYQVAPTSLYEAIKRALENPGTGDMAENIEAYVKDFLNQKFQVAYFKADQARDNTVSIVQDLYEKISR